MDESSSPLCGTLWWICRGTHSTLLRRQDTHITKSWRQFIWFKKNLENGSFSAPFNKGAKVGDSSDRRVSIELSERSLSAKKRADEERAQWKKDRIRTMTNVSVSLGIIEGTSSTMTSSLFLMLPLNPSVIGGKPIPGTYTCLGENTPH